MLSRKTSVAVIAIFALVTVVTLVLGTLGVINYSKTKGRELENVRDALALDADQIAPSLALPIWNFDRPQIDRVVESMMLDPILVGMVVRLADGKSVICARERDAGGNTRAVERDFPASGSLVEKRDITFSGETLATVTLFGTTKFVEAGLRKTLLWTVLNILTLDLILIGGLYVLLRFLVFKPLREVEAYAATVSAGGSAVQSRAFRGELECLRSSIGTMVGQLEARYSQLQAEITERTQAEEALKQSEELYHSLVTHLPASVFRKDPEGRFTFANANFCAAAGRPAHEILGRTDFDFAPRESALEYQANDRRVISTGEVFRREMEETLPDGRKRHVELLKAPVRDTRGQIIGVQGFFLDITERKQAEASLREKQDQLVLAMEISKLAHWEFDVAKNLVTGDERIFQLLGTTSAQEGGLSMSPEEYIRRFVHPSDAGLVASEVTMGVTTTDPHFARQFEHRVIRKDGTEGVMMMRSRIVMDAAGRTGRILGTIQDITEQKRAEVALIQSEERFSRIFESSPIPISLIRMADGTFLDTNESFLQMAGFTREEVIGHTSLELNVYPDPERRAFIWKQLREHGHLHGHDQLFRTKTGQIRNHVLWFDVISISGEQCVLVFALDITDRKKLEEQFLRVQRMESIGTLASGVAHDLNNILSPIMMSVPVLRMEMSAEERERIIETIEMSAERGAQIVKQVLTFGRGLDGEKRPMQVEMLIREMVKIMRGTFPKDITVESAAGSGLWLVLGDATQLHQVLLNLCVNARDAMPDGGRLRLGAINLDMDANYSSMLPESKPGPYVLLEVTDTGSGIPPEIVERIFDPFFTTKGVGKGTGLGLSTVHGIVRSHGGFIKVASEPDKGTSFKVYLPAAPDQDAAASAASPTAPPIGHGELVLVVDDEPAVAKAVRTVLEPHGYRVLVAADGTEALAEFAQNSDSIAVVLTDIMMPLMNGVALVRALQKMKPGIPVIASTGLGEKAHLAELKEMGIETVLKKPYNADTLLHTIHGVLHPLAAVERGTG
jgi:PAS domain S-box-containing protein